MSHNTNQQLIEQHLADILRWRKEGKAQKEVAELLGMTPSTFSKTMKSLGYTYKYTALNKIEDNKEEIIALIKQGKKKSQIAREFGINETTFTHNLKLSSIDYEAIQEEQFRNYDEVVYKNFELILEGILHNTRKEEIAQLLNIDVSSFDIALVRNHIIYPNPRKKKKMSTGEERIAQILDAEGIHYKSQYTFDDCRFYDTNAVARFDFAILDDDDNLEYLIEFDGEQHYYYTGNGWNTKENYEKTKEHDIFKTEYCENNNIPLIRIPYTEKNELTMIDLDILTTKFQVC